MTSHVRWTDKSPAKLEGDYIFKPSGKSVVAANIFMLRPTLHDSLEPISWILLL